MSTMNHGDAVRILVLADDPREAAAAIDALGRSKVANERLIVQSEAEALAYLRSQPPYAGAAPPDLLLLDISQAGQDHSALIRAIKSDPALHDLPILALVHDPAQGPLCAADADHVLTKPLELRQLMRAIASIDSFVIRIVTRSPNLARAG